MNAPSSLDDPSPHLLWRDFLAVEEHRAILDWALANRECFAPSLVGSGKLRADFRSSATAIATDYPWKEAFRQRMLHAVPELARALGVAAFEVEQIQLSLIAYNDGDFYREHIDTEPSRDRADIDRVGDRVLSAVYYFHSEPRAYSGGALRLHAFNPASARFEDSRFAINCWVRRARLAQ